MNRTGPDDQALAPMNDYEVELKYPIQNVAPLIERLEALGARRGSPARQVDRYFAHPCRNFAETDEALRMLPAIRQFLRQGLNDSFSYPDSAVQLQQLLGGKA